LYSKGLINFQYLGVGKQLQKRPEFVAKFPCAPGITQ
jgi:hypothetical protein